MKNTICRFLLLIIFHFFSSVLTIATELPAGFIESKIAEGLDPTHIVLGPEGKIFITEKKGVIRLIKNDVLQEAPFLTIEVDQLGERGLQDMTLHPDFQENGFFYVYYTVPGLNTNRLSRFQASGDIADINSEFVIVETDSLYASYHNGGSLVFGLDGKLYVTTGDGGYSKNAPSLKSLNGKVLRVNDDGSIPADNPYLASTTGKFQAIYSTGFRNPYQASIDPSTRNIYINDVGWDSFEEVNLLLPAKYYGWYQVEGVLGYKPVPHYMDPVFGYSHTDGCAVTGGLIYRSEIPQFPEGYQGKYFYMDYCEGYIKAWNPEDSSIMSFVKGIFQPIDMLVSEDGSLYYLSRRTEGKIAEESGSLWKIEYVGSGAPHISLHPEDQSVYLGETAVFSVVATGSEPLNYQWQKNGTDIQNSNSTQLVIENALEEDSGTKYRVIVFNDISSDTSESATLIISDNKAPEPVITSPLPDFNYTAGEVIFFAGEALDEEDGELAAAQLSWKIDFHHETHTHPALSTLTGVNSGEYFVPSIGETSDDVWYRIYLTAEDSEGLTKTVYQDVFPAKSSITLLTDPSDLYLTLDGVPVQTPYTFISVAGMKRLLGAVSPQNMVQVDYYFEEWDHETDQQHFITVPSNDQTYLARFSIISSVSTGSFRSAVIFPNPVHDIVYISGLPSGLSSVVVYDIYGSQVAEAADKAASIIAIETKRLQKGIYFVYLKAENKTYIQKIVKN